jgi:hypothetical protein
MLLVDGRWFVAAADGRLFFCFRAVWCGLLVRLGWRRFHFRGWFREQELVAAGAGDDFPGGCEEPVAPAFDVPGLGGVAVREGGELDP